MEKFKSYKRKLKFSNLSIIHLEIFHLNNISQEYHLFACFISSSVRLQYDIVLFPPVYVQHVGSFVLFCFFFALSPLLYISDYRFLILLAYFINILILAFCSQG